MKYAILSDIHGNYDALEKVLDAIGQEEVDASFCLGDVVGYGPEPSRCIAAVRQRGLPTVAGNHDFAVIDKVSTNFFNEDAQRSVEWTKRALSNEEKDYLQNLPLTSKADEFIVVHGSLEEPGQFNYVLSHADAQVSLDQMCSRLCFIGHSHVPLSFILRDELEATADGRVELSGENKALINVGSVGQPRDYDPRACYAIYDSEARTVTIKRIDYDIDAVCAKIRDADLPKMNALRLKVGV